MAWLLMILGLLTFVVGFWLTFLVRGTVLVGAVLLLVGLVVFFAGVSRFRQPPTARYNGKTFDTTED